MAKTVIIADDTFGEAFEKQNSMNTELYNKDATEELGTAQGQLKFWDATAGKWVHTEITEIFWDDVNKRFGIKTNNPTASLHLPAGTTTAGTGPLKLTSGALTTAPEPGLIEFLNDMFFVTQTTDNTRKEIKLIDQYYGEMCNYENTALTTIDTQNVYHAVNHFSCPTALLSGFSFVTGIEGTGTIIDYSSTVAGTVLLTDTAHGLSTDDIITVHASTDYNGTVAITKVDDNSFYFTETYTSDQSANWAMGSYLKALTGSEGVYKLSMSNTSFAAATNNTFRFEMNKGLTPLDNIAVERRYSNVDYGSLSVSGLVSLTAGDRVWMSCKNLTSSTDITIRHANINIVRL